MAYDLNQGTVNLWTTLTFLEDRLKNAQALEDFNDVTETLTAIMALRDHLSEWEIETPDEVGDDIIFAPDWVDVDDSDEPLLVIFFGGFPVPFTESKLQALVDGGKHFLNVRQGLLTTGSEEHTIDV